MYGQTGHTTQHWVCCDGAGFSVCMVKPDIPLIIWSGVIQMRSQQVGSNTAQTCWFSLITTRAAVYIFKQRKSIECMAIYLVSLESILGLPYF